MAHQRNQSMGDSLKTPHSVSLKVLRLSRPTLATQQPIPGSHDLGISTKAALAYPQPHETNDNFILSPVLSLPEAFGSAYVGETFACTLCANNEIEPADLSRAVSGVRIQGDMQTPSDPSGSPLDLASSQNDDGGHSLEPGESLQRILRFELKEEGNHVLAVTVTYTETTLGEGKAASGRVRTFRKLYQFVAQQLLNVRTKTSEMSQKNGLCRYLLEAQLENMGDTAVCLEAVNVHPKPPLTSTSLNWDMDLQGAGQHHVPILSPQDVLQVAFLLERQLDESSDGDSNSSATSSRPTIGQLAIQWRSALGDRGSLSTGWLTARS